jgi:amidophosphoribosyltransferase
MPRLASGEHPDESMTSCKTFPDRAPWDLDGDKLREECGIFGVIGSRDAAPMTALGLHALQHRGQEAVGISSWDGTEFYSHRGIGHVAQVFSNSEIMAGLQGTMASGHVRYSTTGGSGLRNVQPLFADLASGGFSIAHNGNISNAMTLKRELVSKGAIFQSTSDTEVIIHLVATSRFPTLLDRFVDALRMVEGAYSLICMTPEGMIACRDPLGIRPLVMGRIGDAIVFASETVAFDVIGAELVRSIEPGELVQVDHKGTVSSHRPFGHQSKRPCIFEHVYFSRPDSVLDGHSVYKVRKHIGIELAKEAAAEVHMRVASPPTEHSCFYGVDTPERSKLLAARMDIAAMADFIKADSLAFVSIDGLYRAVGEAGRNKACPQYCDACFTGDYPTRLTDLADRETPDLLTLPVNKVA